MRGEPSLDKCLAQTRIISTHSPRAGRTLIVIRCLHIRLLFQLTRPVRGEPWDAALKNGAQIISTHSPRAGRTDPAEQAGQIINEFQLTRPVRGEPFGRRSPRHFRGISTHSPRAGRTGIQSGKRGGNERFQLTRPVRGEPDIRRHGLNTVTFQLTRPVRGEPRRLVWQHVHVSNFNSLAPCGANLFILCRVCSITIISTHSPRAGRTFPSWRSTCYLVNFNSLAPCGANLTILLRLCPNRKFQLTRPVRGEPLPSAQILKNHEISTHSPRAGRTRQTYLPFFDYANFNSLAPCGANPYHPTAPSHFHQFQLTRPVRGEPLRR